MNITGLVDALNLLTDLPFAEWAWSEAPDEAYGVVTADGQTELKADEDPAAEKMLTGYVDVFIKATDADPTEEVEDAMRAIGVWFRMESIQFEPDSGFIHIEWRYVDTMNNEKKAILSTLPLMLHVTSAEWNDGDLIVTFSETPGEIYEAIGTRPVGFYVTVEVQEGSLTVTKTFWMNLADYTVISSTKYARFAAFDEGNGRRYLRIFVTATASTVATQGSYEVTAYSTLIFTDNNGYITDPAFTYQTLRGAFLNRTPVYIYYTGGTSNGSVLTLSYVGTYEEEGGQTYYKACFDGGENGIVWEFSAASRNEIMTER